MIQFKSIVQLPPKTIDFWPKQQHFALNACGHRVPLVNQSEHLVRTVTLRMLDKMLCQTEYKWHQCEYPKVNDTKNGQ